MKLMCKLADEQGKWKLAKSETVWELSESERFENTWVKWQSVARDGAQDTDPTDPEWEFTWTVFMSYLIWCLNPSPHVSTTVRSTFPRHIFKYHGKQTGGRLFKRGDDLSLRRLAENNCTSAFRCPVHRHGGDAVEMWEENSQKVIYENVISTSENCSMSWGSFYFLCCSFLCHLRRYFKMIKCHI